ncbi:MAG: TRIC cation channel family protein, partial [Actinocrinis sp.]
GGVVRDVLIAEVPTVLRREFYAIPALFGSLIIVLAARYEPAATPLAFVAAGATAALRMIAAHRDWSARLPRGRGGRSPWSGH